MTTLCHRGGFVAATLGAITSLCATPALAQSEWPSAELSLSRPNLQALAAEDRSGAEDASTTASGDAADDDGADHAGGVSDEPWPRIPRLAPMRGGCGRVERRPNGGELDEALRAPRIRAYALEPRRRLGTDFRGFGSPGRDLEGTVLFGFTTPTVDSPPNHSAMVILLSAQAVVLNVSSEELGRICVTVGTEVLAAAGMVAPVASYMGLRFAPRIGALFRTRDDSVRLRLEGQFLLDPLADAWLDDDPNPHQAGFSGALALSVVDEVLTLAPMEWGIRGIVHLGYRWASPTNPGPGLWLDVRVPLGYARTRSYFGPRDGLVGGLELSILGGGAIDDGLASVRGGLLAGISFGSLWPSDIVLPMELGFRGEVAWSEDEARPVPDTVAPATRHAFSLDLMGVFARNIAFAEMDVFGWENYFRVSLRYTLSFTVETPL